MKIILFFFLLMFLNCSLFSQEDVRLRNGKTIIVNTNGTWKYKQEIPSNNTFTDSRDGHVYHTVKIGTQIWMVENLNTTKYNDGKEIPLVKDNVAWTELSTPAYCWYNYNPTYKTTYGALYNWSAVKTGKLAPKGWHVPTDAEWTTLSDFLGGERLAGDKLRETGSVHWNAGNKGTNASGFTALPGGHCTKNGIFENIGDIGFWWSSTEDIDHNSSAWGRYLFYGLSGVDRSNESITDGLSVRCLKD
jgi:uncharacterized protein (TIGR02145 family)